MNKEWKYKITSNKISVLLIFLMSALFGGITLWLYKTNNAAFWFTGILTSFTAVIFILTIYRFIFYKVLISGDGFYYQTGVGNGKYYSYSEVEKAWVSSGKSQSGAQGEYCNIALYNKRVIRFPIYYNDQKGADYLVKQANADASGKSTVKEKDSYLIDGKDFGKTKIGLGILILFVLAFVDAFLIGEIGFQFIVIANITMGIVAVLLLFNYYLFFKVKIEKDGFYFRTTPFNGRYYKYNEIKDCRETEQRVNRGVYGNGSHRTEYYFFFEFTDSKGKNHKFQYDRQFQGYEVDILKDRIDKAKG